MSEMNNIGMFNLYMAYIYVQICLISRNSYHTFHTIYIWAAWRGAVQRGAIFPVHTTNVILNRRREFHDKINMSAKAQRFLDNLTP